MIRLLGLLAMASLLGGCFNMSGIRGSSESFSCKAPEGVTCTSVSGMYANAVRNNLPGQQKAAQETAASASAPDAARTAPRITLSSGEAIRSQPRVMRIWVAPWEDADGDLHDQSFIFVTVDSGRWLIEHNRARIRQGYAPAKGTAGNIEVQPAAQVAPVPAAVTIPASTQPEGEAHAE